MFTIGSKVQVEFEGRYWDCTVYDKAGNEVALISEDNPDIYRKQKWFPISEVVEKPATASIAPFADSLGETFGVVPVKEEPVKPSKQKVYFDANTSISRVVRHTGEHMGNVTHQHKTIKVAEVYDPVNEVFYWATISYARNCQELGHIVFW